MGDLRLKVDLNKVSVQIYQSTAPSILEGGKPGTVEHCQLLLKFTDCFVCIGNAHYDVIPFGSG